MARSSISIRWFKVEPDEIGALAWSCVYFFCLLAAWYLLRPLRDTMGVAGGVKNLKWLYLGTLTGTLVASVAFSALTVRFSRRRFIPVAYRFFAVNLLIFFVLLEVLPDRCHVNLGRVYFVWASVYTVFVVSVFWSFMADLFTNAQGKRLFPFIAVGGTLGQIAGSYAAGTVAERWGGENLLLLAAVLLEAACWCVAVLNRRPPPRESAAGRDPGPVGGGVLDGARHVLRSWYLAGICLFMLCYTLSSTFLEVTKLDLGSQQSPDADIRTAFFADIDFWTGVATVAAQVFLTSRLIARFGIGLTLGVLPAVTLAGFALLGFSVLRPEAISTVAVLIAFTALRRATNFAVSRPAREVLYTVVSREDKFKSKNLIDTFVYRFGDQIGVWLYTPLQHLSAAGVSFAAVPLAAVWFTIGLLLGRRQRALATAAARGRDDGGTSGSGAARRPG